jgi:hypothetical protein
VNHFENIRDDPIVLIDGEIAAYGGPAKLARRLNKAAANWTAQGDLDFLNNW